MKRTFKGFLQGYCKELSGLNTTSLRKLLQATEGNAGLVEPLFIFAATQGKTDYLVNLSKSKRFHKEYVQLASLLDEAHSIEMLLASGNVPRRYAAVLEAFYAQGDMLAASRRINHLLRERILNSLEEKSVTRYRLCRDLALNPGNVYAYLAGNNAKVSKQTAWKMARYLESLPAPVG